MAINYDKNTQILTLNGNYNVQGGSTLVLGQYLYPYLKSGDKYQFNIEYISGTINGDGTLWLIYEVNNKANQLSTRNFDSSTLNDFNSTKTKVLTINSAAESNGDRFRYYLYNSGKLDTYTFDNYKIRVTFKKIN